MKSDTQRTTVLRGRSDSSRKVGESLSSSLSVFTKDAFTAPQAPSTVLNDGSHKSAQVMQNQFLSKSLEKTFLRMKTNPTARDAYVTAEVITSIAHQIRAIRVQRGWSQLELAKKLGTTQTAISRIEDPSYGRLTLKTLLDLSKVFDAGLQVKFVSLINMLHETYFVKPNTRSVPSFEDESKFVHFYSPRPKQDHQVVISNPQSNSKLNLTVNTVRIESKASTRLNFIKMSNRELVSFVQLGI